MKKDSWAFAAIPHVGFPADGSAASPNSFLYSRTKMVQKRSYLKMTAADSEVWDLNGIIGQYLTYILFVQDNTF